MFKMIANILDVNHSVLSGAMDIVCIKKEDGSLASSPFHIRFGTFKILKTKEKTVEIFVNGKKSELAMKLSSSGDAYFIHEKKRLSKPEVSEGKSENSSTNNSPKKSSEKEDEKELKESANENLEDKRELQQEEDCIVEEVKSEDHSIQVPTFKVQKNDLSPKGLNEIDFNNAPLLEQESIDDSASKSRDLGKTVEISLCYNEILKTPEKAEEIFYKNQVKKEEFLKDPWKVLNNSNVLINFRGKLYTYKAAVALLFSLLTYGEDLPAHIIEELNSSKGVFGLFKSKDSQLSKITLSNQEDHSKENKARKGSHKRSSFGKHKCFVPSSEQLKLLELKEGKNTVTFVCKSRLSGQQIQTSDIYLWNHTDKIVISDIDGTITKSDVLGHLMPMLGKDWSHEGVADLFTNIEKNGYKILYLTARAICQSTVTKNYIQSLFQNDKCLPRGPILMSPDGLVSSFKREVIDKTPQTFKIACLTEIKNLFPKDCFPFFSGFGNRTTDAVSYRSVGIELSKIFIINEKGEVTQLNNSYKKTYTLLNEIVEDLFPLHSLRLEASPILEASKEEVTDKSEVVLEAKVSINA